MLNGMSNLLSLLLTLVSRLVLSNIQLNVGASELLRNNGYATAQIKQKYQILIHAALLLPRDALRSIRRILAA